MQHVGLIRVLLHGKVCSCLVAFKFNSIRRRVVVERTTSAFFPYEFVHSLSHSVGFQWVPRNQVADYVLGPLLLPQLPNCCFFVPLQL